MTSVKGWQKSVRRCGALCLWVYLHDISQRLAKKCASMWGSVPVAAISAKFGTELKKQTAIMADVMADCVQRGPTTDNNSFQFTM